MDNTALFKISYGLFALTAKENEKQNGCIINTAAQVTSTPNRLSITVNKANFTHDMVLRTGEFNISVLSESAPFEVFERFGFHSGRDTEKILTCPYASFADNGIAYLGEYVNAYFSCKTVETLDLGTHTMFIADIADAKVLSDEASMTYDYYHKNVKPQKTEKAKGWKCRICGYVYEGEELPEDFVCPICKHGAADFEKIE